MKPIHIVSTHKNLLNHLNRLTGYIIHVVSLSYADTQPEAVMVKAHYTILTDVAVDWAEWPVNVANPAVPELLCQACAIVNEEHALAICPKMHLGVHQHSWRDSTWVLRVTLRVFLCLIRAFLLTNLGIMPGSVRAVLRNNTLSKISMAQLAMKWPKFMLYYHVLRVEFYKVRSKPDKYGGRKIYEDKCKWQEWKWTIL